MPFSQPGPKHTSRVSTIHTTQATLLKAFGLFERSAGQELHQRNTDPDTVGGWQAVTTTTAPAAVGPKNTRSGAAI